VSNDGTYYAARKTNEFIEMVRENVRDLQSDNLSPFYDLDDVPEEEVATRFNESVAFRSEHDLPPITESSFSSQISQDFGKDTFIEFLNHHGIESEFVEDLFEDDPGDRVPQIPGLTDLIADLVRKGYVIDTDALMAAFPGLDLSTDPVKHLREDPPVTWAEEDSVIAARIRKAKSYSRLYLQGG
jgi:hypothetical protein